jgi:hypothetical protein
MLVGATNRAERLLPTIDAVPARLSVLVPPGDRPRPTDVAWAVRTAGRHLPGTYACLVQALATRALLTAHGHESHLRIGVRMRGGSTAAGTGPQSGWDAPPEQDVPSGDANGFGAHAWVVAPDGTVLVGGLPDLDSFRPIPLDSLARLGR